MKYLVTLFIVLLLACNDEARAPVACSVANDVTLYKFGDAVIDICFEDENVGTLAYTAQSSRPIVVTAEMHGKILNLEGHSIGKAEITVTATDEDGITGNLQIKVIVPNRNPESCLEQADPQLAPISEPVVIPFCFSDADAHDMTYSISTSDPSLIDVELLDTAVVVTALARGDASIEVIATDTHEGMGSLILQTTSPNRNPEICQDLPLEGSVYIGERKAYPFCIRDPDSHALTDSITAGNSVSATLNVLQDTLYITGIMAGSVPVHVRLIDPYGESVEVSIQMTVLEGETFFDDFSDESGGWEATPPRDPERYSDFGKGEMSIREGILRVHTTFDEGGWGGAFRDLRAEDWTITVRMRTVCTCTPALMEIFDQDSNVAYWLGVFPGKTSTPYYRFALRYRDYSKDVLGDWWADYKYDRLISTNTPNDEWLEVAISTFNGRLRVWLNDQLIHVVDQEEAVFSRIRRIELSGLLDDSRHEQYPAEFDLIQVLGINPEQKGKR